VTPGVERTAHPARPDSIGPFTKGRKIWRFAGEQGEFKDDDRVPWDRPADLVAPDTSPDAQYASFIAQIPSAFNEIKLTTLDEDEHVSNAVLSFYDAAHWSIPPDFGTLNFFAKIIQSLNTKAGVGWPLNTSGPATIGEYVLLEGVGNLAQRCVLMLDHFNSTGELHWDPDYLFIKREPHKLKKRDEKKWRLIWGNSFYAQVFQRAVWQASVVAEIAAGRAIPSAGPMGLVQGQSDLLVRHLAEPDGSFNLFAWDFSGFDTTVNRFVIDFDRIDRRRLCHDDGNTEDYAVDFWKLYDCIYAKTYSNTILFGDGQMYDQKTSGIQRSGCFITYSLNSRHTVRCYSLLALRKFGCVDKRRDKFWAAGDDFIGRNPGFTEEFIRENAQAYGQKLKLVEFGGLDTVGFCSHKFFFCSRRRYIGMPDNTTKHRWNLKCKESRAFKALAETCISYMSEYAYADEAFAKGLIDSDIYPALEQLFFDNATKQQVRDMHKSRNSFKQFLAGV
jgi:hypothetical protein